MKFPELPIIKFIYLVFVLKIHEVYREIRKKMDHTKKKKSTETIPEKDFMSGLVDKTFKTTILKI